MKISFKTGILEKGFLRIGRLNLNLYAGLKKYKLLFFIEKFNSINIFFISVTEILVDLVANKYPIASLGCFKIDRNFL